jgi:hypothetical protein
VHDVALLGNAVVSGIFARNVSGRGGISQLLGSCMTIIDGAIVKIWKNEWLKGNAFRMREMETIYLGGACEDILDGALDTESPLPSSSINTVLTFETLVGQCNKS